MATTTALSAAIAESRHELSIAMVLALLIASLLWRGKCVHHSCRRRKSPPPFFSSFRNTPSNPFVSQATLDDVISAKDSNYQCASSYLSRGASTRPASTFFEPDGLCRGGNASSVLQNIPFPSLNDYNGFDSSPEWGNRQTKICHAYQPLANPNYPAYRATGSLGKSPYLYVSKCSCNNVLKICSSNSHLLFFILIFVCL